MKKRISLFALTIVMLVFTACGSAPELTRYTTDAETGNRTNTFTGLTAVASDGWYFAEEDAFTALYYTDITEEELSAMTPRQLAEMEYIYDYFMADEKGDNMVLVYIYNTAINYADSKTPARDFINEFVARSEDIPARHTGTAVIGGKEYTTITYYKDSRRQHFALRDVGGGYVSVIVCASGQNASGQYFWDLFGEGHTKTAAAVENVPDLRTYDEKTAVFTNESTGIKAAIPKGWTGKTLDGIGENIYGVEKGVYTSQTKEQLAKVGNIYDIVLEENNTDNHIRVYYANTVADPSSYKLTPEEIITQELDISMEYVDNVIDIGETEVNGNIFTGKRIETNYGAKFYMLTRKLNEDFVVVIRIKTYNDTDLLSYMSVFNENKYMPPDNVIRISTYDENTKQFRNEKTGFVITVPEGWEKAPLENMEAICWNNPGEIDIQSFTDEDYACYTYIPDCYIWSEDVDAYVLYINKHNLVTGVEAKPTLSEYYDQEMEMNKQYGAVTRESSFELAGYTFYIYSLRRTEGGKNFIGIADLNQDYFVEFVYRNNNTDITIDDYLDVFAQ